MSCPVGTVTADLQEQAGDCTPSASTMKEVVYWSPKKVADWLLENAMPEYCEPLEHFTGRDLINLTREDFKKPPLCRVSSDNGQRLLDMIETLKMEHHMEAHKNGHANGHLNIGVDVPTPDSSFSIKIKPNGMPNGYRKEMIKIPMPELERSQYPMEWGKTFLAFLYALSCFVLTTVMISVVHERVPPKEVQPPLPDTFFDHFNRVQWAFSICEINGMILVGLWLIQWLLLKYKSIISRRFFCIVGTLYLYRCITMYVTTLPVPGMHFNCSPKLFGDWEAQLRRIMKLIAGGGLSITGSHNMCGDYLYSGHTVMLTLTYLFIKECKSNATIHHSFLTCHIPRSLVLWKIMLYGGVAEARLEASGGRWLHLITMSGMQLAPKGNMWKDINVLLAKVSCFLHVSVVLGWRQFPAECAGCVMTQWYSSVRNQKEIS